MHLPERLDSTAAFLAHHQTLPQRPATADHAHDDNRAHASATRPAAAAANLLLGHAATQLLQADDDVVLTLADAPILAVDGGRLAINDAEEVLENVTMAEDARRERAGRIARGGGETSFAGRTFSGFDSSVVLGKYDDEPERQTTRLDAKGCLDEARRRKLEEVRARLASSAAGGAKVAHDIGSAAPEPSREFASGADYMAPADASFRKVGAKEKRRVRKKPRAQKLDLDALAADEAASGGGGGGGNYGSQALRESRQSAREAEASLGRAERAKRFDRALELAEEATLARIGGKGGGEPGPPPPTAAEGPGLLLHAAISRARRIEGASVPGGVDGDGAAQRLRAHMQQVDTWARQNAARAAIEDGGNGGIEFSETGEFVQALGQGDKDSGAGTLTPSTQQEREEPPRDVAAGRERFDAVVSGDPMDQSDSDAADATSDAGPSTAPLGLLREEATKAGLAGVLRTARSRGVLGKAPEAGRSNDRKGSGIHNLADDDEGDSSFNFKLQYLDEYGREMTQKEAYRHLCWQFHGKPPSRKRREKRMRQYERQMNERATDAAGAAVSALQAVQRESRTPYVLFDK